MSVEVIHGDCLEVLKSFPDNHFDSSVSDPPSGIGFMGADWDLDKGGMDEWCDWLEGVMAETLRVLKPGAYAFVWALPRTSHWTALALERAGFWVIDSVQHLFGTGFPKSKNASLAIDDHDFRQWLHAHPDELELHRKTRKRCKELKQSKTEWRNGRDSRATCARRLRKRVDRMQRARAGLLREVVRSYTASGNAGTPIDEKGGTYVTGAPNSDAVELHETRGATERSQQWDGFGTGLKPGAEIWWLVQKPFKGTIANNLLTHGVGAMNLDGCRVATDWAERPESWRKSGNSAKPDADKIAAPPGEGINCHPKGRFPANVLLSHNHDCRDGWCTEGCPVRVLGEQSGDGKSSGGLSPGSVQGVNGQLRRAGDSLGANAGGLGDSGTAARYFQQFRQDPGFYYCPKPSTAERDAGLDGFRALDGAEATKSSEGAERLASPRTGAGRNGNRRNIHPTVKSEAFLRYLMRLITPPGGHCLDMFAGSGSGGVAAVKEGFSWTGIELNDSEKEPYVSIARARIKSAQDSDDGRQTSIFDILNGQT